MTNKIDIKKIDHSRYDAYIFDFDGTLVNTMPLRYSCLKKALQEAAAPVTLSKAWFFAQGGLSTKDIVVSLGRRHSTTLDSDAIANRGKALFSITDECWKPIPEVVKFAISQQGVKPMAIATGSNIQTVEAVLEKTQLHKLFSCIVTSDDVKHSKPAPDIFLAAADKMKVSSERCLVFEDGILGIEGAKAAGMDYVVVKQRKKL